METLENPPRMPDLLKICGLILITLVAYEPAIHAGFIWDDDYYVVNNKTLRDLQGLWEIWFDPKASIQYYPLVFTSFWAEYHLWGADPAGYHIDNILLHGTNALLLCWVLRLLSIPGAWLVATLFALHPVHVESVAWITERKNVLSGFFYLGSLGFYLRHAGFGAHGFSAPSPVSPPSLRQKSFYIISWMLFLCALWSKTVTCSLPAVILLLLWWKDLLNWRHMVKTLPFFVAGAGMALVTIWMEYRAGTHGVEWELSWMERILIAGRALWFYIGKLLWPLNLSFIYPRWEIDAGDWRQILYPVSFLTLTGGLWFLRKRLGKGPITALLIFSGTLLPALGFFNTYPMRFSFVADHFQYLASIGALAVFPMFFRRGILPIAALAILGSLTWTQAHAYKDQETLWRNVLDRNPGAWIAHNNLAILLAEQNKPQEAKAHYLVAIRLKPNYDHAFNNLGLLLLDEGRLEEALSQFEKILRFDNPYHAAALANIGLIKLRQGLLAEAKNHLAGALKINPDYTPARINMGLVFFNMGRHEDAIRQYELALSNQPNSADIRYYIGMALLSLKKIEAARIELQTSLLLAPERAETRRALDSLAGQKEN